MIPLYSQEEFTQCKSKNKLPCQCEYCNNTFFIIKHEIVKHINNPTKRSAKIKFCNKQCASNFRFQNNRKHEVECANCNCKFLKYQNQIKKSKNNFCSRSCNASYTNKNKKIGTVVSKLEVYLQTALKQKFPKLEFLFNNKEIIGSELDIFIPSMNLAFEISGIYHFKPIFGESKLIQIQNNDLNKKIICSSKNIDLHVIDTSDQIKFSESSSEKYFNYIKNIVNDNI